MAEKVNLRTALGNQTDLTTPTEAQVYKLGTIVETIDEDTKSVHKYIYVKSHGALTQYQPYVVTASGTAGSEVITAAPVATASAVVLVGVPQVAFTSGYYGFVQIEGKGTAVIAASTGYVDGNAMEVIGAGTSLIAASTGTVATINTSAYLVTATTGTSGSVVLPGNRVEITT